VRPVGADRWDAARLARGGAGPERPERPERTEWKPHEPKAKSAWSPPIDGVVTPAPDKPYKPGWAKPKAGPKGGKSNDWKAKAEGTGDKPKGDWKPKGPPGGFKGKPFKPKFKPRAPK
jgi:hypothetical protein